MPLSELGQGLGYVLLQVGDGFKADGKTHQTALMRPRHAARGPHVVRHAQADGAGPAVAQLEKSQAVAEFFDLALREAGVEHGTEEAGSAGAVTLPGGMAR